MPISPYKLIVVLFVFYLVHPSCADDSNLEIYKNPPVFTIEGKVEKIDAPSQINYKEFVKQQKTPVILRKTIADTWVASQKWSVKYLNTNLPALKKVHISDSYRIDFFNGVNDYPMSSLPTVPREWNTTIREIMSTRAFFGKINDPANEKFVYYTGNLYNFHKKIWPDVKPIEQFWVRKEGKQVNVWMGSKGVTAQAHYDASYNFFVQIMGRKRFLLFAPTQCDNLYMYPMLHPYARQSQVNLETPDLTKFPNITKAHAIEAILEPGDVLFLPPYWVHHVTALDLSASVNAWSDAEEQLTYTKKITKEPLPMENDWAIEKRIQLVRHFLYKLLYSVLGEGKAHEFLHERIYESRYKNFLNTAFVSPPSIDLSSCKKIDQTEAVAQTAEVDNDAATTILTGVDSSTINGEKIEEFEEKIELSEADNKEELKTDEIQEEKKQNDENEKDKSETQPAGEYDEEKEGINKFLTEKILPGFEEVKAHGREGVTELLLAHYIESAVEVMFGVANIPYYLDQCL